MTVHTLQQALSKGMCLVCQASAYERCFTVEGLNRFERTGICEVCEEEINNDLNQRDRDNDGQDTQTAER